MNKILVLLFAGIIVLSLSISHKQRTGQVTVKNEVLIAKTYDSTRNVEHPKKPNTFHRNASSGEVLPPIPVGLPHELHPYWSYVEEFLDAEKGITPTNGVSEEVFSWRMEHENLSPEQIDELRAQWLKSSVIGENPVDLAIKKSYREYAHNELVEQLGQEKAELFFKWLYSTPMASR